MSVVAIHSGFEYDIFLVVGIVPVIPFPDSVEVEE
jgi:hypothetical protein